MVIVSPQFPPSNLAAVHRARHMAKYLPRHGWRPIVVRVAEDQYVERVDPALGELVPKSVEQIPTGALPAQWSRRLGVGDLGLRAYAHIGAALRRHMTQHRPDVLFFTGFPFYPMLLATGLKRRFGVPVVLDFQDPWASDFGAAQSPLSKAGLAHRLAVWLEPMALRAADFVTSVSETQNQALAARYPWIDPDKMAALPIGGDPEDYEALRQSEAGSPWLEADRINLSYVGAFLPRAAPLVRQLFRAVRGLKVSNPELRARLRLNFIGTSNSPEGHGGFLVRPIAEEEGVDDLVRETPERIPFLEALRVLANSQGLLLVGSDERHYTASKIYPGLMSGRPFLSLFHQASSAHRILSEAGGGVCLAFEDHSGLSALTPAIQAGLLRLVEEPASLGRADPAAYAPFTANAIAGRFADIFDGLTQTRQA